MKCPKCGTKMKVRTNYSFGKKSKPTTTAICPFHGIVEKKTSNSRRKK